MLVFLLFVSAPFENRHIDTYRLGGIAMLELKKRIIIEWIQRYMVLNEITPFKTVLEICSGDQVSFK